MSESQINLELQDDSEIVATYPCFNLAAGVYRLTLEIKDTDCQELYAQSSNVIEVYQYDAPSGGRPAMVNLGYVDCEKLVEVSE